MKNKDQEKPKVRITRKQFNEGKKEARMEAFMRHVADILQVSRVNTEKPFNVILDKGGIYLSDDVKGSRTKTFVIISWVASNQMKEYVMVFQDLSEAQSFTKEFKKEYKNTRILQAIE